MTTPTPPPVPIRCDRPDCRCARDTPVRLDQWRKVHCPDCGRYLCSVMAGGVVRIKCGKCKAEIIKDVAA